MSFLKNLFNSFTSSIGRTLGRILVYIVIGIILALLFAERSKALTITDSTNTISESNYNMFINMYERSSFNYYIIFRDSNTSYNTNNYLCLTNSKLDISNSVNIKTTCDELYTYSYSNGNYSLKLKENESITLNNTIYYTNGLVRDSYINIYIAIIVSCIFMFLVLSSIFLKQRNGGLHYENIK